MEERIRDLLYEYKRGLSDIYGQRLVGAYLFGSYARGEQDEESDVDILIVLEGLWRYGAEVDRTSELTSRIALNYGLSISRVFLSRQDWEAADVPFVASVRSEAVPA